MQRSTSRWIVGVSAGGIVHIGVFWMVALVSDSDEANRKRQSKGASLQYIGSDTEELSQVMKEQIMLFDPKPLMKPTQWNWANFERIEDYSNVDSAPFPDYAPLFSSDSGNFVESFGNSWSRAGVPRENQLAFPYVATRQFGREESIRSRSGLEGLGVEIVEVGTGRSVVSKATSVSVGRSVLEVEEAWESVEFLVQVVDSFQVGTPSTVQSSRFPEIDRKLSELMTKELLPKGLLLNGSYLVRISR
ncbi:MAG: hypothetical protein P8L49_13345 [Opitutaceae bacterium]|nr:hypothetical protein [Opitutaceae bacterium]